LKVVGLRNTVDFLPSASNIAVLFSISTTNILIHTTLFRVLKKKTEKKGKSPSFWEFSEAYLRKMLQRVGVKIKQ